MRAYWFDNEKVLEKTHRFPLRSLCWLASQGDQREDHDSGRSVDARYLSNLGVLYYHCPSIAEVDAIALQRSYKNRDEITVSPEKMGTLYEDKVNMFFDEHLHEDEEIRYIHDGEGFFDVRSVDDNWFVMSSFRIYGRSCKRISRHDLQFPMQSKHRATYLDRPTGHANMSLPLGSGSGWERVIFWFCQPVNLPLFCKLSTRPWGANAESTPGIFHRFTTDNGNVSHG